MFVDGEQIARQGFFVGYNPVVWLTIAFQTIGGILVSLCIMYADNIAKSFAMSISILIGLCASVWFFNFTVTTNVSYSSSSCPGFGLLTCIVHFRHLSCSVRNLSLQQRTGASSAPGADTDTRL